MRQQIEIHHRLMIRESYKDGWLSWCKPISERYRPAEVLSSQGRLVESLESAMNARITIHGDMSGVQFCIETTTKIVTTL